MKLNYRSTKRMTRSILESCQLITLLVLGGNSFFHLAQGQYFKIDFLFLKRNIHSKTTVFVSSAENLKKLLTHHKAKIGYLIWSKTGVKLNVDRYFNNHNSWFFSFRPYLVSSGVETQLLYEEKGNQTWVRIQYA